MKRHIRFALAALALSAVPLAATSAHVGSASARASAAVSFATSELKGARGGEPSIATNRLGDVYVTGPQGLGSGPKQQKPGVAVWTSRDNGATWGLADRRGSYTGGGDSDVAVPADEPSTVYLADLEGTASAICKSTDKAATWNSIGPLPDPNQCGGVVAGQVGPSSDREWLTTDKGGRAYLTYHEFVSSQPIMFRTDNGGADLFGAGPCGSIITDPAIETNVPQDLTGGTLVSKPVVDKQGNLYVLFTTPDQASNVKSLPSVSATVSQVYMAVSHDGCASFTDYVVYDGVKNGLNAVHFGDIFNQLAIDGAGNLYAAAAGFVGTTTPTTQTADIYLFSSTDGGKTWGSGPRKITNTGAGTTSANMMPAAYGGPMAGQLAIGFYQTTNGTTNPNDPTAVWDYVSAISPHATKPGAADFTFTDVRPGFSYHTGDICTSGILCGSGAPGTGNDRSLADFTSVTVDGNGCALYTFAGNGKQVDSLNTAADAGKTFNFVARQTSRCFAVPETNGDGGGNNGGGTNNGGGNNGGGSATPTPTATPGGAVQGLTSTPAAGVVGAGVGTPGTGGGGLGAAGQGHGIADSVAAAADRWGWEILSGVLLIALGLTGIVRRRRRPISPG